MLGALNAAAHDEHVVQRNLEALKQMARRLQRRGVTVVLLRAAAAARIRLVCRTW